MSGGKPSHFRIEMTEGQTCHIGNPLILTLCFAFFITLIFNIYISDQTNPIPQKLPQIANTRDNSLQGVPFFAKIQGCW